MATLGQIKGQMVLDVSQALAAYTAVRLAHLTTVTALGTGGAALMTAGGILAGVGLAIGAGLYVAVDAAAEFERKLDYFTAVSASTQDEYEAIRLKALELGKDTIYSANEIGDSFVELAKAGVSAKDIVDGIGEGVANLGAAADIPLDTAANIIMSAVQTFGLGADKAVGVADTLAGAANASIVEVQDLGISLKYAGGVASALGIPFEDVADALALLGTYGIRGSTAGTSMRQMLVSLGGATGPATKQLKELGIITEDGKNKFFDAEGRAKSLGEVFQILQDATKDMTDEQRLGALKTIFQNRALGAAIALTKEGSAGFAAMHEEIGKTTAMDVANERLDNLSGDIEILRGNVETLAIESGSQLQAFFRGLVQGITQVVQWFSNLDENTQAMILKILAFSAAGLVVIGFMGMLAGSLLRIGAFVIKFIDTLKLLVPVFKAVGTAFRFLFLGSNPIGWIILAVMALVAAFMWLWKNVEGFRNFFIAAWAAIQAGASAAITWFGTLPAWFSNLWNTIVTWATTTWNSFITFIGSIPGRVTAFFAGIGAWFAALWTSITTWATNAWNGVLAFFAALPGRIVAFLQGLPAMIGYIIGFAVGTVVRLVTEFSTWLMTAITTLVANVIVWFQALPGRLAAFWSNIVATARTLWNNLKTNVTNAARTMVTSVIAFIVTLPGRVANFFSDMYNRVRNWMIKLVAQARTQASAIVTGIVSFLQNLPARVVAFFTSLYTQARAKLQQLVDTARTMGSQILSAIVDKVNSIPGAVSGAIGNAISAFKNMVSSAFNAAKNFASGLWEGFKDGLGIASPSYIERAMWAITDVTGAEAERLKKQVSGIQRISSKLNHIGADTGIGFANGVGSVADQLAAQINRTKKLQSDFARIDAARALGAALPNITSLPSAVGSNTTEGDTTIFSGDIILSAKDLEDIKTFEDFTEMMRRKVRQKVGK